VWPPSSADTVCFRPSVTLTFDRLTLKLVCGTFLPNLGVLGLWVLELFATYTWRTDRQTDGQKQRLLSPSLRSGHKHLWRRPGSVYTFTFSITQVQCSANARPGFSDFAFVYVSASIFVTSVGWAAIFIAKLNFPLIALYFVWCIFGVEVGYVNDHCIYRWSKQVKSALVHVVGYLVHCNCKHWKSDFSYH